MDSHHIGLKDSKKPNFFYSECTFCFAYLTFCAYVVPYVVTEMDRKPNSLKWQVFYELYYCKHSKLNVHHQSFHTNQKKLKSDQNWQSWVLPNQPFCEQRNGAIFCQILEIIAFSERFDDGLQVYNDCNHQRNKSHANFVDFVGTTFWSLHIALHMHKKLNRQSKTCP